MRQLSCMVSGGAFMGITFEAVHLLQDGSAFSAVLCAILAGVNLGGLLFVVGRASHD